MENFSSVRMFLGSLIDSLLRVPSLFYLEIVWKSYLFIPQSSSNPRILATCILNWMTKYFLVFNDSSSDGNLKYYFQVGIDNIFISVIINYACFFLFFGIAFLPFSKLVNIYLYLLFFVIMVTAGLLSNLLITFQMQQSAYISVDKIINFTAENFLFDYHVLQYPGWHFVAQLTLAVMATYLLNLTFLSFFAVGVFMLPTLLILTDLIHISEVQLVHNTCSIFIVSVCFFFLLSKLELFFEHLKMGYYYLRFFFTRMALLDVPMFLWTNFRLAQQMLLFWIGLFSARFYYHINTSYVDDGQSGIHMEHSVFFLILRCVVESCRSPGSIIALCVTVSYAAFACLGVAHFFLHGRQGFAAPENMAQRGWAEGMIMMLLALQADFTDTKNTQRFTLMIIVFFIILSSLLESVHSFCAPFLLTLAASQSRAIWRHVRGLILALLLLFTPVLMTVVILQYFVIDLWLLIILSSSLMTTIQVMSTLLTYILLIVEQWRTEPCENTEDIVMYIKSVVCVMEFIVALIIVAFGIYECFFGRWNWISALILTAHFYFNVWERLRIGWHSYRLRRAALRRVESLHVASAEELALHNDVCSICHAEMREARRTYCGHYFHAICLRKWLGRSSTCPFCLTMVPEKPLAQTRPNVIRGNAAINVEDNDEYAVEEDSSEALSEVLDTDSSIYDDKDVDLALYYEGPSSPEPDGDSYSSNECSFSYEEDDFVEISESV